VGDEVKLKPCPFCGGEAEIDDKIYSFGPVEVVVQCSNNNCGVVPTTNYYYDKARSIKEWNKRTTHT